jgi:hypothetical protein
MTGASQDPPKLTTLGAPRGRGGALRPQKHVRSCRTSSTLQHHSPEAAPTTVTCSYIVGCSAVTDEFLAGAPRYTTRQRQSVPPWGTHGPGGARFPYFSPLEWQVTRVSPYVRGLFPSKEIRRISERDDPGPPVVPEGLGIGSGSRTLERAGR